MVYDNQRCTIGGGYQAAQFFAQESQRWARAKILEQIQVVVIQHRIRKLRTSLA